VGAIATGSAAPAATAGSPGRLPAGTLARVFLRSLALQASWNRRGMQNLGFAYAIWPAIEALYPDPERRLHAARRHLAFFNTHPYLAAAILGGAIHHEEKVARGEEPPESVERFKQALMGPFAAVGDSFYWLSLRPFVGAIAALLAPWVGLWAVAIYLLLFDVPHLWLRLALFLRGYRRGDGVVETVARAGLPAKGARLRVATAALGGVAAAFAALFAAGAAYPGLAPEVGAPFAVGGAVAAWGIAFLALGRRGPLVAAGIGVAFGFFVALLSREVGGGS
jgi:PTS system mannose-specific IID component